MDIPTCGFIKGGLSVGIPEVYSGSGDVAPPGWRLEGGVGIGAGDQGMFRGGRQ